MSALQTLTAPVGWKDGSPDYRGDEFTFGVGETEAIQMAIDSE